MRDHLPSDLLAWSVFFFAIGLVYWWIPLKG